MMNSKFRQILVLSTSIILLILILILISGCREEEMIIPPTYTNVTNANSEDLTYKGFYLLNQGNMGSNKSTLDYFDYKAGSYVKNIYAYRNPDVVQELGDVGNDIEIYDDKIFAVINCSNLVEVMDINTAKHIKQIAIPNCRYITFKNAYAYVSSYAGPVKLDPNARLGYVAKIDLNTLEITDTCVVGYQPEQMVIVNNKLYVANSGGYRFPDYDNTVSVIDLNTFKEIKKIDVAINLHGMKLMVNGDIYVSSRGDYNNIPSQTYIIHTNTDEVEEFPEPLPNSSMAIYKNLLYVIGNNMTQEDSFSYTIVNTDTKKIISENFISDSSDSIITVPYAIAINPETGYIYITDAKDYVSPGTIYCYNNEGKLQWNTTTGDIPSNIAFTKTSLEISLIGEDSSTDNSSSKYISKVYDYSPAPGQFVNELPPYQIGDTKADMIQKVEDCISGVSTGTLISLGGFGGSVTFGFDHTIENVPGLHDFKIYGNAFLNETNLDITLTKKGGSAEPGIIEVSYDANKNGYPDDEWYQIKGSEYDNPSTIHDYKITYFRPETEVTGDIDKYYKWTNNQGETGYKSKNQYHNHSYYPLWIKSDYLEFSGERLPNNAINENESYWVMYCYDWGYADNVPNSDDASSYDISWAIKEDGSPANLEGIDFIRIYTAVDQDCGNIGELSTEISGAEDLHYEDIKIQSKEQ